MLPFVRMLEYGNIAPVPLNDIKTVSYAYDTLILTNAGKLYGSGYNRYGELCTGDTLVKKEWVLISTGVSEIVFHNRYTYVIKQGDMYYAAGPMNMFSLTYTKLTDITSYFAGYNFTKIRGNSVTIFGIDSSGDLYGLSSNNTRGVLGNGTTTNTSTFIKLVSNVREVYSNSENNSFYIDKDGILFGTGWNNGGSIGSGSTTQLNTWTELSRANGFGTVRDVCTSTSTTWVINDAGRVYGCGGLGNGLGQSRPYYLQITGIPLINTTDVINLSSSDSTWNLMALYNSSTGTIYYSGNQVPMGISNGSTQNYTLYSINIPSTIEIESKSYFQLNEVSGCLFDFKKLYLTGDGRFIPGYPVTSTSNSFTDIPLPPDVV